MEQRIIKFRLHDKNGDIIGYEYHEPNEWGVIQIYHQSLRGDFDHDDKRLVREGYFIPCSFKCQFIGKLDIDKKEIYEGDILPCGKQNCVVVFGRVRSGFGYHFDYKPGWGGKVDKFYSINGKDKVIGNIYQNPKLIKDK